ncbi:MAG TPA: GNAT family protein [Candidatus Limnocylindrales bacterium]|nr:GNAT family protein [Candidatus Limnocylindrales bacterium]
MRRLGTDAIMPGMDESLPADDDPRPLGRTHPPFDPQPVILTGRLVRLEPLTLDHVERLAEVALDAEIWRWTRDRPGTLAELRAYVERALHAASTGSEVPFAQIDLATGRAIGSTRFLSIVREERRLEIGHTWVGRAFWGRGHNPDAKRILLAHAFDDLGAHRVEFKTDALNGRSRAALARIGATEEGTLRRHLHTYGNRVRDSVYFSVIWEEWSQVRDRLDASIDEAVARA